MRRSAATIIGLVALGTTLPARAQEALGAGLTMYFQMGGNPGDGSTLPRTTGARAAAAAFGVKLVEQYSGWQPEVMLNHFREALAASPACIEIMGHPGSNAFQSLVADAEKRGVVVTSGNSPLTQLEKQYVASGFGYAGVDLYEGGKLTAQKMIEFGGLKKGDKALEYGLRSQAERGKSDQGLFDTLKAAGLQVDYIEISPEVDHDSSLAVPILTAYLQKHPDLKAIGTQHGNVTAFAGKAVQQAGKKPGEVIVGGIDLAPATIDGLKSGYVSVVLDQQLYLQGFLPVVQCVLSKRYGFAGMSTNTGAGVVTSKTINQLVPLIQKGIR
ncbi:MAG TPA: substrate-binding domain-containing protein [Anaeromyxobacteraceae bacterium]|nr:substrate-binding domain-containing protein [Anaeromyxobacteraceae bacterium]